MLEQKLIIYEIKKIVTKGTRGKWIKVDELLQSFIFSFNCNLYKDTRIDNNNNK